MFPPSAERGLCYLAVVLSESAGSRANQTENLKTRKWLWGRSFSESSDLQARFGCWTLNVWWLMGSNYNQAANRKTRNLVWGRSFSESSDYGGPPQLRTPTFPIPLH